jgi:REP element-mobilizing transposase RayT
MEIEHIHKNHNVNLLLYHLVCPIKYRRKVLTKEVAKTLKNICLEIEQRYELKYIEVGVDNNYVHFMIQGLPMLSPKRIAQITKGITARLIFKQHPEVKKMLWGGKFWTNGYYINTIGKYGNEEIIKNYVKNQGKDYNQLYHTQLTLF